MRAWPRNLFGRMLLLMAAALLVAQATNLAMLLSEVRSRRANFVAGGAVARATDVVERIEHGLDLPRGMGGGPDKLAITVGALASGDNFTRDPTIESRLVEALREARTPYQGVRVYRADNDVGRDALIVAVRLPDGRWVNLQSELPPGESSLIWRAVLQTLIIFFALFVAVSLIGRHVTQPLRNLKKAAGDFGTVNAVDAVPVEGPNDVQQLISAFNQMATRLRQMLEEKDCMLGAIGHDLRTPLASLRLRVEGIKDEAERAKAVETIDEMGRTLEDILALARIGRAGDEPDSVELSSLTDALVQDLQDLDQPVHFTPSERMVVRVRPAALRRAVRNLIENAVAYGGEADVSLRRKGNRAIMVIRDFGPGIPDADLERVFDGFVRLESSRSRGTGGSGLGLTLARGIIQDLGGTLSLENAEPGLRATIVLPVVA